MLNDWICLDMDGFIVGAGTSEHHARQVANGFGLPFVTVRELTEAERDNPLAKARPRLHPAILKLAAA